MSRYKHNRDIAFKQYKEKHGFANYNFCFFHSTMCAYIGEKPKSRLYYSNIGCLHTFLKVWKRTKYVVCIEDGIEMHFANVEDFIRHILIKKLSCI